MMNLTEKKIHFFFDKTFVEKVNILGLASTDENFVRNQMGDIFKSKNFNELLEHTSLFRNKLLQLGCFKAVEALIDSSDGKQTRQFFILIREPYLISKGFLSLR